MYGVDIRLAWQLVQYANGNSSEPLLQNELEKNVWKYRKKGAGGNVQLDQLSELQKQRATKPTTMAGLISRFKQLGEQWRVDHTESNEKT